VVGVSVYYRDQAKLARRMTAFLLFLVGVVLTVALYYVKTRAQSAKTEVRQLERQLTAENVAINVLRAEIAHLENPERLKRLAREQLGLMDTLATQNLSEADIAVEIPLRAAEELNFEPIPDSGL